MKIFKFIFILFIGYTFSCCNLVKNNEKKLPNIIIIYADDMGYGDVSYQNSSSKISTPNIDQLAKEGMRFSDAHSTSGVCSPSRYSLLTGRYHWRGHLKTGIVGSWGDPAIEENRLTIASMLKQKGYETACIGKWHLGMIWPFKKGIGQNKIQKSTWNSTLNKKFTVNDFDWDKQIKRGPTSNGFDYYFGDGTINFPPYTWIENNHFIAPPTTMLRLKGAKPAEGKWECRPGPANENWDISAVPIKMTEKSVAYINSKKGSKKPFFLYFALPSPHAPIVPAKQFQGKSNAGGYGDYVMQTDWMVGEITKALKDADLDKNTLVIFTSDNGPEHYAYKRAQNYNHKSMGNWRGLKRDLWEGGHRVPFVVKYPGVVKENTLNNHLISQVDIMKTIAEIVNYPLPENAGEDSINFLNSFNGSNKNQLRNSVIYHTINGKFAIRQNNWVLIENKTGTVTRVPNWVNSQNIVNNTPMLLYNILEDPKQAENLYNKNPEIVQALLNTLNKTRGL